MTGVPVMSGRVTLLMRGGRGRWFVVLLVGCVIHPGPSLRYSPPVSTKRQDRRGPPLQAIYAMIGVALVLVAFRWLLNAGLTRLDGRPHGASGHDGIGT